MRREGYTVAHWFRESQSTTEGRYVQPVQLMVVRVMADIVHITVK